MLLENTSEGVIVFGLIKKGSEPVLCIPGVNHINNVDWKELSKNPSIVEMQKSGKKGMAPKLIVVAEPTTDKKKIAEAEKLGIPLDFLDLEEDEVTDIIEKTYFLPLLKSWYDTTHDMPKVSRLIGQQIDLAGPTAIKKSRDD